MITCSLTYTIDPAKVEQFEVYAKAWITLVNRMGGTHHGYWLPHEGANDIAYAHFSFPSLAAYEDYRIQMASDPDCQRAYSYEQKHRSILRYDRSFTKPLMTGATVDELGL